MSIDQLTAEAMALPAGERLTHAHALLDSVPDQDEPEYLREILRRVEEMDSGKVKGIPWEEVRGKMRRELGCD